MASGELDQAIILHCRSYRETSLLVDMFTRDHGRLRVLSKGARRGRQPLAALLRPFNRVRVSWTGRGDLPVLTGVEPVASGAELTGIAIYCGFYLCELVMSLLPLHDPHPELYALCEETLARLGTAGDLERTLRRFELAFLEGIGYGMRLDEDVEGKAIKPDRPYWYDPEQGPRETTDATADTCLGATLLALSQDQFEDGRQMREAKRLIRRVLAHHLNGRPLKSRELFKSLSIQTQYAS